MLSVQSYNYQPNLSFARKDETKVPKGDYYKTHAGLKTGTVVGVLSAASSLCINVFAKPTAGFDKKLGAIIPLSVAIYMGCGALVDKFINNKRAEFAKSSQDKDMKDVIKENKKAEVTRNGNVYHKSDVGKKYGALLGAVGFPILIASRRAIRGYALPSVVGILLNAAIGIVGGLTLGSIADKCANKGAKKFADKAEK